MFLLQRAQLNADRQYLHFSHCELPSSHVDERIPTECIRAINGPEVRFEVVLPFKTLCCGDDQPSVRIEYPMKRHAGSCSCTKAF